MNVWDHRSNQLPRFHCVVCFPPPCNAVHVYAWYFHNIRHILFEWFSCIVRVFKEPGRPVRVEYATSGDDKYDEGIVQTAKVKTSNYDPSQKFIYVSMWAVNKVKSIWKKKLKLTMYLKFINHYNMCWFMIMNKFGKLHWHDSFVLVYICVFNIKLEKIFHRCVL